MGSPSPATAAVLISISHPLLSILNTCTTLSQLQQSHAQLIVSGLASHPFPPSKLLTKLIALSSPLALSYAHLLFSHSPSPPLFSFNSLIKAHSFFPQSSSSSSAPLLLFRSLLRSSHVSPNQYTFVFLFSVCRPNGGVGLVEGLQGRGQAVKRGFEVSNVFVANVLVKMYSRWGFMKEARKVFDECGRAKDLFSWNSLIGGYVGIGDLDSAKKVFDEMPHRDHVSWSTVIAGYVQVGCFLEALGLFCEMQNAGVAPNEFTLTAILAACANIIALDQGRWVHLYIKKAEVTVNDRLLAGLIDMYAKCGEIGSAVEVFTSQVGTKHTIRPWNAMLSGFAIHGLCNEAIALFERMKTVELAPDAVTFVSLLNACSHGKLVDIGRSYFDSMKAVYGIDPEIEHYGCLVDLLGRAGFLNEAEELISSMPIPPDAATWGALLSACQLHGDTERGERIGRVVTELEPKHVGCNVLLANMFSKSARWTDAKEVRNNIEGHGRRKTPGCSSIELNGMFNEFFVGDISHPQVKEINDFLEEMAVKLKIAGYLPEVRDVLLDIDGEDRETALSRHSEKLAIAFGLMNTPPGTAIRIVKNLRICGDCHHATKYISKVYEREIIVRDRIRFHHFNNGVCSCKDYW